MTQESLYNELTAKLKSVGQTHLLRFWNDLSDRQKEQLAGQIQMFDWQRLHDWIQQYVVRTPVTELPHDLAPAPVRPLTPRTPQEKELYSKAWQHSEQLLREGKIAGFTVAGGQGTRLGYDAPKGTFRVSPVQEKPLFQLFAESLLRAQEKYRTIVPWYIMTSPVNDAATRTFFQDNDFFGLNPENIMFFQQGVMPAISLDGNVLLAEPDSLALSPNGHGGSLLAMYKSGALADMRRRGIEHISYWQVDNPLVYPLDRLFIGLHALLGSDMSCRSLTKSGPYEKLGHFCVCDGRTVIIEYSDMPAKLCEEVDTEGRLRYGAGSPAIHVLSRRFVEDMTAGGELRLPWHRAEKKVPCVDERGNRVTPAKPNAVKLEMFIFDALPEAKNVLILEADRNEQFGPVKNAEGEDSPASCRHLMIERAARWLNSAGIPVPRTADGQADCVIELSPKTYLDPEDVAAQATRIAPPARGAKEYYP